MIIVFECHVVTDNARLTLTKCCTTTVNKVKRTIPIMSHS